IFPDDYQRLNIPACYLYADTLKFAGEIIDTAYVNKPLLQTPGSCEAVFEQSAHYNFTDLNLVTPLRYSPMLGKVDNKLMAHNLETFILNFFDQHLKKQTKFDSLQLPKVKIVKY
ncbi:MAG: hypothetical protein OEZ58_15625, partial [Gammaproteobacteria bacterium]|nr:hypothetical protein [Gammaproteobacteria bacterium]